MLVSPRDAEIVRLVGRLGQVSSRHVQALLFNELASATPCKRALVRLCESKMLARIERRMIGGYKGGSGVYCYQLGSKGWQYLNREGRYWAQRSISYHTLAIADVYLNIKQAERAGLLRVVAVETEPDTWRTIAGAELRPDLFVELALEDKRHNVALWLEVDLGTERPKQVKEMLARYWHAFNHSGAEHLPTFPYVLFLTPDTARTDEVRYIINHGKPEARGLFGAVELASFPQVIL